MVVAKNKGADFLPPPNGIHQAVCVDVIDLGIIKDQQFGDTHKIVVSWQIDAIMPNTQQRFLASKRYTLSLNEKANLAKDLETWRGRLFTDEEREAGFDLERLIGVNCMLQIIQNTTPRGTFGNVTSVTPLHKNTPKMVPVGYVRKKDRDPNEGGQNAPARTSEPADDPFADSIGGGGGPDDDIPF